MSHSLVKLIDIAILPAALMVVGKFVGLVFVISVFRLPWRIADLPESLFAIRPALLPQDIILASTYSDIITYIGIAIAFSFILLQATHFHETHIRPSMLIRLSNHNLLGLVKSSFDLYHAAAVWLLFIWISTGLVWLNVLVAKTEAWAGLVTLIASVIFTTLLLQDVYKEIEIGRKSLGSQQAFS